MVPRKSRPAPSDARRRVERVQTGVRIERRVLQVLKGLAESHDMTLGDLIEGVVLHAFEGRPPFGPESRARIEALRGVYGLDLTAADSHLLVESPRRRVAPPSKKRRAGGRGGAS